MSPSVAEQPERVAPSGVPGEIVHLDDLRPSPLNPRKRFEKGTMADLEANIQKHGVIVPLLVRRHALPTGWVGEVIDGERRYRAAKAAGAQFVPCVFRDELTDGEVIEIQLLSAIQRQDLTPLEEAAGFRALIDSNPSLYSAAYIADRVGRSEKYVWDRMKLLELIPILNRGLKPVTVKELESWIAHHVRFDVEHMAATAPLEFAEVGAKVEEALAQPGRGRKVISITNEYRVADDAKDPSNRTYGSQAWERADGKEKSKTCEHSVLGVFVAGPGYGTTLQVCVNRDKCQVHFAQVIRDREKNAKLRAKGKGGQAAQREVKAEENHEQRWRREQAEREAKAKAWAEIWPRLRVEALRQLKDVKKLTAKQASSLEKSNSELMVDPRACKAAGFMWWENMALALLVSELQYAEDANDFKAFASQVAPLGLDMKKLEAIRDAHEKKAPPPAVPAKKSATKVSAKAKAGKKATRR